MLAFWKFNNPFDDKILQNYSFFFFPGTLDEGEGLKVFCATYCSLNLNSPFICAIVDEAKKIEPLFLMQFLGYNDAL